MNARQQLLSAGQFNKELASMAGQKISKKLKTRQKDWELMVNRTDFKANDGVNPGYHKPGSQK